MIQSTLASENVTAYTARNSAESRTLPDGEARIIRYVLAAGASDKTTAKQTPQRHVNDGSDQPERGRQPKFLKPEGARVGMACVTSIRTAAFS